MKNISYYLSGIRNSFCDGYISLEQLAHSIREPKPQVKQLLQDISNAAANGNKEEKNRLKNQLPFFTPSVVIPKGYARRYANIQSFTNLMQLDFDNFDSKEEALDFKDFLWNESEIKGSLVLCFISPSQKGIKTLLHIPKAKDTDDFKAYFRAVQNYFDTITPCFDSAPLNAVLPLYISHDPEILYRPIQEAETYTKQFFREEITYHNTQQKHTPTSQGKYYKATVRIFTDKINTITNQNGHTSLRSSCLWLGSKAAANYISPTEATSLAENLIRSNGYLSRSGESGIANYIKTSIWAINKGMTRPLYYEYF